MGRRVFMERAMIELFNTPFRGAALGLGIVALWVLILSYSDFLLSIFDQSPNRAERDARRLRFRKYALLLLCGAIGMVAISNLLAWGTT